MSILFRGPNQSSSDAIPKQICSQGDVYYHTDSLSDFVGTVRRAKGGDMLVLEILGGWVLGSCTIGPLLAWVVFQPVRRRAEGRATLNLCGGLDTVVCLGGRDRGGT